MLRKLLEPFVWVIGAAAGAGFLGAVILLGSYPENDLKWWSPAFLEHVAIAAPLVANLFGLVWIVVHFGVRGFPAAKALSRTLWLSWILAGSVDVGGVGAFGSLVQSWVVKPGTASLVIYTVLILLVNLYAVARVYRYSRIAEAAKVAGDKKPFAGWNTKAMKILAGLTSLVVVGLLVFIVIGQKHW